MDDAAAEAGREALLSRHLLQGKLHSVPLTFNCNGPTVQRFNGPQSGSVVS